LSSPPSSATSRSPASSAAWRLAMRASMPRSARVRTSCIPTGSTAPRSRAGWRRCRQRPTPEMSMPPPADDTPENSARFLLAVLAMTAAGFGLTLLVFYPGVMTFDARYVYEYVGRGFMGDWQSPVMTVLWAWIDPIAPGSASMFLLSVAFFWLTLRPVGI